MIKSEHHPEFFTPTILEWKHLLKEDKYKEIILDSLRFLVHVSLMKNIQRRRTVVLFQLCTMFKITTPTKAKEVAVNSPKEYNYIIESSGGTTRMFSAIPRNTNEECFSSSKI